MKCVNVLQRGIICEPIRCFATGKGSCENCRRFESTRFECCQEVLKTEGKVSNEEIGLLMDFMKRLEQKKNPEKTAKPLAVEQPRYNDEIPF
jgi:hypothetical protein